MGKCYFVIYLVTALEPLVFSIGRCGRLSIAGTEPVVGGLFGSFAVEWFDCVAVIPLEYSNSQSLHLIDC